MTDPLDRAVDARIDAFRPDTLPPFTAIESRKRARDRRRLATGGGLLSALAVVGAVVLVPALTGGGDRLTPGPVAEGPGLPRVQGEERPVRDAGNNQYEVRYGGPFDLGTGPEALGKAEAAIEQCLRFSEPDYLTRSESTPTLYTAIVIGQDNIDAFEGCIRAIPDVNLKLVSSTPPVGVGALRINAPSVTGARVCLADFSGGYPDSGCRSLDEGSARRLAAALDGAEQLAGGTVCTAGGPQYRILLAEPGTKPAPIVVPTPCGPITVVGNAFRLNERVVRAVATEYARGAKNIGSTDETRVTLSDVGRGCGPSDMVGIVGTVSGPPSLLDYDGLQVEVKAEGTLVGSVRLTSSEFIVYPKGGGELPETADVTVVTDDRVVVASETAVDLRFQSEDPESICG